MRAKNKLKNENKIISNEDEQLIQKIDEYNTGETNEIHPKQIQVTSNKDKSNINTNQNNQESTGRKEDILKMKQISKSKIKQFINDALKKHNDLRVQHNSEPLTISEDLNEIAQKYAERLAKIKKFIFLKTL